MTNTNGRISRNSRLRGPGDGGQSAGAPREQRVAQEGLAEIVGGVAERDDVRAQSAHDLVDRAPAEAAALVAAMIGLLLKQTEGGIVAMIGPVDSARLQIFSKRFERAQKFPLLHRKRAYGEIDRRALLQEQQRVQHCERIFAAGERHGDAVALADHVESRDRLAHLAEECFFEIQLAVTH